MSTPKQKLMKKALFILTITTIALTGFRKSDALVVSFNDDNSKALDLSKKNISTALWSVTTDTTKKGGGGRGDIITYRGNGGRPTIIKEQTKKNETGGNGGVGKEAKGNNKTEGGVVGKQKDN